MPLMLLVPPSTRPRGIASTRPPRFGWGTDSYFQSTSVPHSVKYSTGVEMDGVVVGTAGLDQRDRDLRVVREPARERAARRSRSDDHVVERVAHAPAPVSTWKISVRNGAETWPSGIERDQIGELRRPAIVHRRLEEPLEGLRVGDLRVVEDHRLGDERRELRDALLAELLDELGPDGVVLRAVLGERAGRELDRVGQSDHDGTSSPRAGAHTAPRWNRLRERRQCAAERQTRPASLPRGRLPKLAVRGCSRSRAPPSCSLARA